MREQIEKMKSDLESADFVLVGIGSEFAESFHKISETDLYKKLMVLADNREENIQEFLPILKYYYLKNNISQNIIDAYNKLEELLRGKNYFVVSTCYDDLIRHSNFESEKYVAPCGTFHKIQCSSECENTLSHEHIQMDQFIELIFQAEDFSKLSLPVCDKCGKQLEFNNILTTQYDENGYLPQWDIYTKWLQLSLNKKVCVIELGVSMNFPSVIRWPFEKVVYFNQKASFYRVNQTLYQLTEEIKERGVSVPQNALDFISNNLSN